ncbi:MAG: redoxin domain-containing protein [Phycisphaerae bacterium]|jgi:peroxiredoxin
MRTWIAVAAAAALAATWSVTPRRECQAQQSAPTTQPVLLDVGSPAPPVRAETWLNGPAVAVDQGDDKHIYVVAFWAGWSSPSVAALPALVALHERFVERGVTIVAVTEDRVDAVRDFLEKADPKLPFRVAVDVDGATTRAYCEAAGVGFVPYAFVIGQDHTIAWHGHPQQPELAQIVEQLLRGDYDLEAAARLVQQSRSVDQLEALFRDACAGQAWHTALLALDALLQTDVPQQRLLRYKLSILLGELGDLEAARAFADQMIAQRGEQAALLNSLAWDVVSEPRLYTRDPAIGFKLARAAFKAGGGRDAGIADTYARALHLVGRVDLAVTVQRKAVELATPLQREQFEKMLTFYEQCAALARDATAEPK